jgi:hypothetical protein
MAVIKVPKTPKKAYNENRRPSALLLSQIEHFEWASRPASQRKPNQLRKPRVRTEREAAERIAELTRKVLAAKDATAHIAHPGPPNPPVSPTHQSSAPVKAKRRTTSLRKRMKTASSTGRGSKRAKSTGRRRTRR